MEFVGFWGQPGQPPKGKSQPEGVNPIAFNTQASPAEYGLVYPEGSSTKFYLHTTTSPETAAELPQTRSPSLASTSTPVNKEDPKEIDQPETPTSSTDSSAPGAGRITLVGVACFLLGFLSKYLFDCLCNQTRGGYSRIAETADISI
jgi:hypothetical protein